MEWRKINIYSLKQTIDTMILNHENCFNSMSDRAYILFDKNGIELRQICEYPECSQDVYHVEEQQYQQYKVK